MSAPAVQIENITYNAATQGFEALVRVHTNGQQSYPCSISAPITTSFEEAASALAQQALNRHQRKTGQNLHLPRQRAGRGRFDAHKWLNELITEPGKRLA